jgi:DNA-binding NarL/FixJ family response regulator
VNDPAGAAAMSSSGASEYRHARGVGSTRPIRLVVVEDDTLYLDLLTVSLSHQPDLEVVGSYRGPEPVLAAIAALAPDVALLDVNLRAEVNGVQLAVRLRAVLPRLGVVFLSHFVSPDILDTLSDEQLAGCSYLLKRSAVHVDTLVRAIRGAVEGLVTLDPHLVSGRIARTNSRITSLSPRKRQLLDLLAQGWTNEAIAKRLFLSPKTVENHIYSLYADLGITREDPLVNSRVRAVRMLLESTLPSGDGDG